MADTGGNSLWKDIENVEADATKVETEILGPSYSYADAISGPSTLGVGSNGTFSQLGTNASAIAYYVEALITGNPPLGNQYFVNTGGMCTAPDGTLKPRYNYINNMSSGAAALPAAISEIGSDFNGLLPGVADDIEGLNPLHLFSSLTADANPPCVCLQCPASNPSGIDSKFVTASLSADVASSQCTPVDSSVCIASASTTESFSNKEEFVSMIPTIIAGLGVLYFIFSGR
uniref:Uncharacterized protein n=1 Tax=viral metagenome TaxID=1070528 RepID=A0A6C0EPL1_9ZZZZ